MTFSSGTRFGRYEGLPIGNLIVGDKDKLVPYDQSLEMAGARKAAGVRH